MIGRLERFLQHKIEVGCNSAPVGEKEALNNLMPSRFPEPSLEPGEILSSEFDKLAARASNGCVLAHEYLSAWESLLMIPSS